MSGEGSPSRKPSRDISKSMVALVVSCAAAAVLGAVSYLPPYLGRTDTVRDVTPGLLEIGPGVRGVAVLGKGATASVYLSGIRIERDDRILTETVRAGAPVSAILGTVRRTDSGAHESVTQVLNNVRITEARILPGVATYEGIVFSETESLPLRIRIELAGRLVRIGISVPGAAAVVVHLDPKAATYGIQPYLPARNLRLGTWWVRAGAPADKPLFRTILHTQVAVGPGRAPRAMDLSHMGRHDIHVWASTALLTISPTPIPVAH
ncbi:MAG TPA: hypothetical protein VFJ22_05425 [Dermatophilaceae bacterium]|nr:hypothetical protein [Dermatophilaceae bacterium]